VPSAALSLVAVLSLALALRWPLLHLVPHLTDETGEVLFAWDIAFEGVRPLTHTDAYNGPLWPYLLAAAFRLFGSSPELPRLFALGLGLATVALTWGLGGLLAPAGRRPAAATVAGALMATSFTHALVGSRVAWSNSSTPLWTTATILLLVAATRREGKRGAGPLAGAGFLGGLALQTHPSVIVLLAGVGVWFVLDRGRRDLLRTPGPWLAPAAAALAYSPVIVANLTAGLVTMAEAGASANAVARPTLAGWASGVGAALAQLGRSAAGGFDLGGVDPSPPVVVAGWLYAGLTIGAALALARDRAAPPGRRLPLVVAAVALAGLPVVNRNWQGFLEARYLAFTLPPLYAAMGAVASRRWSGWRSERWGAGDGAETGRATSSSSRPSPRASLRTWIGAVATLILVVLVALPALRVRRYERAALAERHDNRRLLAMTAVAEEAARGAGREAGGRGTRVFVDLDLRNVPWRAGGHPRRAVEYLLTLASVPFTRAPEEKINHFLALGDDDMLLFLAGPTAERLGAHYVLEVVDIAPRPGEGAWGLYRVRAP